MPKFIETSKGKIFQVYAEYTNSYYCLAEQFETSVQVETIEKKDVRQIWEESYEN